MGNIESEYPNSLLLSEAEVEGNPYCNTSHEAAFYRMFAEKAYGLSWDKVENLDCRKVVVSPDIQKSWYQNRPADVSSAQLSMALIIGGPKAEPGLPPRTVRWADDCIS